MYHFLNTVRRGWQALSTSSQATVAASAALVTSTLSHNRTQFSGSGGR